MSIINPENGHRVCEFSPVSVCEGKQIHVFA